jgi:hypothetical protein
MIRVSRIGRWFCVVGPRGGVMGYTLTAAVWRYRIARRESWIVLGHLSQAGVVPTFRA